MKLQGFSIRRPLTLALFLNLVPRISNVPPPIPPLIESYDYLAHSIAHPHINLNSLLTNQYIIMYVFLVPMT